MPSLRSGSQVLKFVLPWQQQWMHLFCYCKAQNLIQYTHKFSDHQPCQWPCKSISELHSPARSSSFGHMRYSPTDVIVSDKTTKKYGGLPLHQDRQLRSEQGDEYRMEFETPMNGSPDCRQWAQGPGYRDLQLFDKPSAVTVHILITQDKKYVEMTGSTVETYMTVILWPLFGAEHGMNEFLMNRHIFRTTENVNVQAKLQTPRSPACD
jgi:hypothetical protein